MTLWLHSNRSSSDLEGSGGEAGLACAGNSTSLKEGGLAGKGNFKHILKENVSECARAIRGKEKGTLGLVTPPCHLSQKEIWTRAAGTRAGVGQDPVG